jgi:hypothetical protein
MRRQRVQTKKEGKKHFRDLPVRVIPDFRDLPLRVIPDFRDLPLRVIPAVMQDQN